MCAKVVTSSIKALGLSRVNSRNALNEIAKELEKEERLNRNVDADIEHYMRQKKIIDECFEIAKATGDIVNYLYYGTLRQKNQENLSKCWRRKNKLIWANLQKNKQR